MNIHFYADFETLNRIDSGSVEAVSTTRNFETDIHFTVSTDTYNIYPTEYPTDFKVGKRTWKL